MRTISNCLLVSALIIYCAPPANSKTDGSLTFNYREIGGSGGIPPLSKLVVYEGQNRLGESMAENSVTIPLSKGKHHIRAVLLTLYDRHNWEEHLTSNEFSMDCLFEDVVEIKGKKVINLVFDHDQDKTISSYQSASAKALADKPTPSSSASEGTITFKYSTTGISYGYDHKSKLVIYEGEKIIGESSVKYASIENVVTIPISNGNHQIRAVLFFELNGIWKEQLKANESIMDCLFKKNIVVQGNKIVRLVFDQHQRKTLIK